MTPKREWGQGERNMAVKEEPREMGAQRKKKEELTNL